jgi:hypothetical protein
LGRLISYADHYGGELIIQGRERNVTGEVGRAYAKAHRWYNAHKIARIAWFPLFFLGIGLRWTLDGPYGLASIWLLSVGVSALASGMWVVAKIYFWKADKLYRKSMH